MIDVPGPTPTAPTVVLLHALGCTAYLSWALALGELSQHYRVITLDQRWHGRGIRSPRFRFADCADDVAAVLDELGVERAVIAGYSMGGAIAQLMWRRHPERVAGLVLCSTARNYRGATRERFFFPVLTAAMHPLSRVALTRVERMAATLPELPSLDIADPAAWGKAEFRSTSAWSMPEVLSELGRFNSAPWIAGGRRTHLGRGDRLRPHDSRSAGSAGSRRASRVRRCTRHPAGTPRSCSVRRPGCPCSWRPSPTWSAGSDDSPASRSRAESRTVRSGGETVTGTPFSAATPGHVQALGVGEVVGRDADDLARVGEAYAVELVSVAVGQRDHPAHHVVGRPDLGGHLADPGGDVDGSPRR